LEKKKKLLVHELLTVLLDVGSVWGRQIMQLVSLVLSRPWPPKPDVLLLRYRGDGGSNQYEFANGSG
jgi:hypothetical protein